MMILADKIIRLRKKNGWSQEELAERLKVSRQSVSKWEGAQSVPDLDKILQLSKIFGVSIDYLLKEEFEEEEYITEDTSEETLARRVSLEEANAFLTIKKATAGKIAFAVFLCILSPICLILLGVASESGVLSVSENMAGGIGLVVMLLMVAVAAAVFVLCGAQTKPYEYLEKELIDTEYGVSGMVRERKKQYRSTYTKYNVIGTSVCILSVVPLMIGAFTENAFAAVMGLAITMMTAAIGAIYWLTAVALFLGYSFYTNDWKNSWLIWPVAGVVFAAVMTAYQVFRKK